MDFVTITDHDTIDGVLRDRRPPRRLRLRGADRLLPRRAAGRSRPLLRASRPTTTSGCRRTRRRRAVRRRTCTSTRSRARSRTPSTPSPPARRRATAAGWRELFAVWEIAQRLARARAQPARRHLRRDARRHRRRRLRRPRRAWTSAAPTPRRRRASTPAASSSRRSRRAERARAASRAAPRSGPTPRWRSRPRARARPAARRRPTRARSSRMVERVMSEGDARAGALGADLGPEDARAPAARLAATRSTSTARRAELLALHAGGRLQPRRRCSAARGARTSAGCAAPSSGARGRAGGGDAGARRRAASSRPASPAIPYAPAAAFLGAREGQARRAREGEPRRASRSSPTASAAMHGVTTRSRRSASAACPASRSRSIGTDPQSTAA